MPPKKKHRKKWNEQPKNKPKSTNTANQNTNKIIAKDDKDRAIRLADFSREILKLRKLTETLITSLDKGDQSKYAGRYKWFLKKEIEFFESEGIKFMDFDIGLPYDTGLAVSAINENEFSPEEAKIIAQVIEPAIIHNDKVIKYGLVVLGRKEQ